MNVKNILGLALLSSIGLQAQDTDENYDGPYVFRRNDSIVVKNVINGVYKNLSEDYAKNKTVTCYFPNNIKFSIPLKKQIVTDTPENATLPSEFLVISDLEGEFDAFATLLKASGVMGNDYKWTYGNKHLFIIGDMIDRGLSATEVLWLIYKLEDEAKAAGGAVHYLLGNHEIMNLTRSNLTYVPPKYIAAGGTLEKIGEDIEKAYGSESEIGRWLRAKNIIERFDKTAFLHGGLTKKVAELPYYNYQKYNDVARHYIENDATCKYTDTTENENCIAINKGSTSGIYWDRTVAEGKVSVDDLDASLKAMEIDRFMIGHTEVLDANGKHRIRQHDTYGDKVFLIDIGHHDFINSKTEQALYYKDGCYKNFTTSPTNRAKYTNLTCPGATTSVKTISATDDQFKISPNPFSGEIIIKITPSTDDSIITIYDMKGQLLESKSIQAGKSDISLDLSYLPKGMYRVNLNNKKCSSSTSIIKNA